ncbi:hypothetical protein LP7551_03265 [Roseibium album]|nr:hypothetical protein LP7551_03265 [Roseibium album]
MAIAFTAVNDIGVLEDESKHALQTSTLPGSRKCLGQLQPWSPVWVNRIRNRFQSLKEDAVRRRHIRGGWLADQASIRQDLSCERHASLASSGCASTPLPSNGFTLNTKPDRGIYLYEVGLRPVRLIGRTRLNGFRFSSELSADAGRWQQRPNCCQ